MLKKTLLFITIVLPFTFGQSFAMWDSFEVNEKEEGKTVAAVWKTDKGRTFTLSSAGPEDFEYYKETLNQLLIKDGYPPADGSEGRFKAQNLDRQRAGNLYHLYKVSHRAEGLDETPLGFVQFGRMPSMGYPEGIEGNPTAHHPIIKNWIELGITQKRNAEGGLDNDNLARIENRGLAMILPIFKQEAEESQRSSSIEACNEFVCNLAKQGNLLPVEGTIPFVSVGLFHPEDPNVALFEENGFEKDNNPGFGWFYPREGVPQDRTLLTRSIEL